MGMWTWCNSLNQTATKLKLVATGRSHSESLTTCFWLNVIPSSSRWFQAHFPIFWWIILITLVFGFTTLRRNVIYRSSTSHRASHSPLAVQSNRPYIVHNTVPRDPQCSSHRLVDRHLKVHKSNWLTANGPLGHRHGLQSVRVALVALPYQPSKHFSQSSPDKNNKIHTGHKLKEATNYMFGQFKSR